jgi:hypothetical protein
MMRFNSPAYQKTGPLILATVIYFLLAGILFSVDFYTRPIWLDEALTYYEVSGKSFVEFVRSLNLGVNVLPYAYFVFPWTLGQFVDLSPLALRLPSLVFASLTLLTAHVILRNYCGDLLAFAAVIFAFILSSEYNIYISEARPYSLYVLAACLHFHASERLAGQSIKSRWLVNSLAALALPSIHYVGLFYSAGLALAIALTENENYQRFKKLSSFAVGWLGFAIIHASLIWKTIHGEMLSSTDYFTRPTLNKAILGLDGFFDFYPETSLCILLLALSLYFFKLVKLENACLQFEGLTRGVSRFCIISAFVWLLIPWLFTFAASVGFLNFTIPRYSLPTLFAKAIAIALVIHVLFVMLTHPASLYTFSKIEVSSSFVGRAIVVGVIGFALIKLCGIQYRVFSTASADGIKVYGEKIIPPDESDLIFYTTNSFDFVSFAYHTRADKSKKVCLVLEDSSPATWCTFSNQLLFVRSSEICQQRPPFFISVLKADMKNIKTMSRKLLDELLDLGRKVEQVKSSESAVLFKVT